METKNVKLLTKYISTYRYILCCLFLSDPLMQHYKNMLAETLILNLRFHSTANKYHLLWTDINSLFLEKCSKILFHTLIRISETGSKQSVNCIEITRNISSYTTTSIYHFMKLLNLNAQYVVIITL